MKPDPRRDGPLRRRKPRKGDHALRLFCEALEDRTLLATNMWNSSVGGSWQTASNWSLDHVPTNGEDVVIPELSGTQTITYSSGTSTIQSLTTSTNVDLSGGTLNVTGTIQSSGGQLTLDGATLGDGTIAAGTTLAGQSGTLDGVTIDGDFTVADNSIVTITNGLTLNGSATLGGGGDYGYLYFNGSQTLGGTGTVVLSGSGYGALALPNATLTLGAGITVEGGNGYLGYSPEFGGSAADTTVVNQGTIEWSNGGNILIEGTLTNGGMITVDGTSTLATEGTISGGTITTQAGASIVNGTLNGVTIDGDFTVAGNNIVTITNGLTLNGSATLGGGGDYGYLYFNGSQTLGGTGTVVLSGSGYGALALPNATLTLGAGITVGGGNGYLGYSPEFGGTAADTTVVNQGTIEWSNGGNIVIAGTLTNSGMITVDSSSTLNTDGTISGGTITTQAGASILNGTLDGVTIDGDFTVDGNNIVTITNGLTLNGSATLGGGGDYGYLYFNGSQTLGGTGTVALVVRATAEIRPAQRDADPGHGDHGRGRRWLPGLQPGVRRIAEQHPTVVNQGTIEWSNGGNIVIAGTLTNSGTITRRRDHSTLATEGTISGSTINIQAEGKRF